MELSVLDAHVQELRDLLAQPHSSVVEKKINQKLTDMGLLPAGIGTPINIDPTTTGTGGSATITTVKTTLACYAVENGLVDVLKFAIDKGSNPKAETKGTTTVSGGTTSTETKSTAQLAAERGDDADTHTRGVLRQLVNAGVDFTPPDVQNELRANGLDDIVKTYQFQHKMSIFDWEHATPTTVETLLNELPDPNFKDENGFTIAHHLAGFNNEAALKFLIEQNADLDESTFNRITIDSVRDNVKKTYQTHQAKSLLPNFWRDGDITVLDNIIKSGVDVNTVLNSNPNAFDYIAEHNRSDILNLLVQNGMGWNRQVGGRTIAHWAAVRGNEALLMNLVEHSFETGGVDWTIPDHSTPPQTPQSLLVGPLATKIQEASSATWSLLNEDWAEDWEDPTNKGKEKFQEYLAKGARINAQDSAGKSALSKAIYTEEKTIVEAVLNAGADVNKPNKNGYTGAHFAAETGNEKIIKLLKGADFNIKAGGRTATHIALDAAATPLVPGADVNEQMKNVALALVEVGANFDEEDSSGKKAIDYLPNEIKDEIKAKIAERDASRGHEDDDDEIVGSVETDENDDDEVIGSVNTGDEEDGNTPSSETNEPSERTPGAAETKLGTAMKRVTKKFCETLFEKDYNSPEDFANAFMFGLLAFPLDVLSQYIDPTQDPQLDELKAIKEELARQRANGGDADGNGTGGRSPVSGLTDEQLNLFQLMLAVREANPEAYDELYNKVGRLSLEEMGNLTSEQMQARAQKAEQILNGDPVLKGKIEQSCRDVANLAAGQRLIAKCFHRHDSNFTPRDVIDMFSGRIATGGRPAPDGRPAPTPDGSPAPDTTDLTAKAQAEVRNEFSKILGDTTLSKETKEEYIAVFLDKYAKEYPQFKNLSMAFNLNKHHASVLKNMKKHDLTAPPDRFLDNDEEKLTDSGLQALKNKVRRNPELSKLDDKDLREVGDIAFTLKKRLDKGSKDGEVYLRGLVDEGIGKITK